jgi:hypothetical protein
VLRPNSPRVRCGPRHPRVGRPARPPVAVVLSLVLVALASGEALAADPLGMYMGGAIGRSEVEANAPIGDLKANHSAFKVMAGLRPISLVGAELAYISFGHPSGNMSSNTLGGQVSDVSMKGVAAFGVLYFPVSVVDLFAKAGLARLQSTVNYYVALGRPCSILNPNCNNFSLNRTNTSYSVGAGAQVKFGSWAVRAEYERFNAAGGNPALLSLGVTWAFL